MSLEDEAVQEEKAETVEPKEKEEAPNPAAAPERPQGYVPHEALHEQREITKRQAQELSQYKERTEKMETTFQKLLSSLNEKPAPEFDKDPLGHFQYRNEQLEQRLGDVTGKLEKFENQAQSQAQLNQVFNAITASEQEFRIQTKDYDDAVKFLKDARKDELKELGLTAVETEHALNAEVMALAQGALARGKNPALVAYKMAEKRGYKTTKENPIETIAKGMEVSKTVQGKGESKPLKLSDLSQLPEDKQNAFIKGLTDKQWKALISGQTIQ